MNDWHEKALRGPNSKLEWEWNSNYGRRQAVVVCLKTGKRSPYECSNVGDSEAEEAVVFENTGYTSHNQ